MGSSLEAFSLGSREEGSSAKSKSGAGGLQGLWGL